MASRARVWLNGRPSADVKTVLVPSAFQRTRPPLLAAHTPSPAGTRSWFHVVLLNTCGSLSSSSSNGCPVLLMATAAVGVEIKGSVCRTC